MSYPNPNNIKVGDIVRVKSGGPRMCVAWIDDTDEIGQALCEFSMSGIGVGVVPKKFEERYHVAALRKCWFGII